MPGILFKNRENLGFALKFNKICQNQEFSNFKIPYSPILLEHFNITA